MDRTSPFLPLSPVSPCYSPRKSQGDKKLKKPKIKSQKSILSLTAESQSFHDFGQNYNPKKNKYSEILDKSKHYPVETSYDVRNSNAVSKNPYKSQKQNQSISLEFINEACAKIMESVKKSMEILIKHNSMKHKMRNKNENDNQLKKIRSFNERSPMTIMSENYDKDKQLKKVRSYNEGKKSVQKEICLQHYKQMDECLKTRDPNSKPPQFTECLSSYKNFGKSLAAMKNKKYQNSENKENKFRSYDDLKKLQNKNNSQSSTSRIAKSSNKDKDKGKSLYNDKEKLLSMKKGKQQNSKNNVKLEKPKNIDNIKKLSKNSKDFESESIRNQKSNSSSMEIDLQSSMEDIEGEEIYLQRSSYIKDCLIERDNNRKIPKFTDCLSSYKEMVKLLAMKNCKCQNLENNDIMEKCRKVDDIKALHNSKNNEWKSERNQRSNSRSIVMDPYRSMGAVSSPPSRSLIEKSSFKDNEKCQCCRCESKMNQRSNRSSVAMDPYSSMGAVSAPPSTSMIEKSSFKDNGELQRSNRSSVAMDPYSSMGAVSAPPSSSMIEKSSFKDNGELQRSSAAMDPYSSSFNDNRKFQCCRCESETTQRNNRSSAAMDHYSSSFNDNGKLQCCRCESETTQRSNRSSAAMDHYSSSFNDNRKLQCCRCESKTNQRNNRSSSLPSRLLIIRSSFNENGNLQYCDCGSEKNQRSSVAVSAPPSSSMIAQTSFRDNGKLQCCRCESETNQRSNRSCVEINPYSSWGPVPSLSDAARNSMTKALSEINNDPSNADIPFGEKLSDITITAEETNL